jgi:hypothetical protein
MEDKVSIKIDRGIPIPPPGHFVSAHRPRKYPVDNLGRGESFFVPGKTSTQIGPILQGYSRSLGHRYVTRNVVEDDVQGVRVWRLR